MGAVRGQLHDHNALRVLQSADDHGLVASDYGANEVARAIEGEGDSEESIPVHVVYFTVWPRSDGGFDAWPDVYGYDAIQSADGQHSATRQSHN